MSKVIIIGGGIGGLASANLLAQKGHEVHVYEKNAQLGGRAGRLQRDGFTFDTGPSWYLMPEVFERYYRQLGRSVADELSIIRLRPGYKVFYESHPPITISGDSLTDAATFEAIEPGAGDKLLAYVRDARHTYDIAVKHFLYTNYRPSDYPRLIHGDIVRSAPKFIRLLTRSVHQHVARTFRDQRLQQILEYTTVFLGASPYKTPALYTLMAALDFDDGVYYPQGGIYTVIESLVKIGQQSGVRYHVNAPVEKILVDGKRAAGVQLLGGERVSADVILSNADLHYTETRILPPQARSYSDGYWQRGNPGPGALLLYLGVKGSLPQLEHHDLYFVDNWHDNFAAIYDRRAIPQHASLYVSRTSATDPSVAPAGHEALVVLVPFPPDHSLSPAQADTLADQYIATMAQKMNIPDLAERIVLREIRLPQSYSEEFNAWQSTALGPAHILRQSALFRSRNRSRKLKNLFYVGGSTLPGIGLPMCIISAELAARNIATPTTRSQVN